MKYLKVLCLIVLTVCLTSCTKSEPMNTNLVIVGKDMIHSFELKDDNINVTGVKERNNISDYNFIQDKVVENKDYYFSRTSAVSTLFNKNESYFARFDKNNLDEHVVASNVDKYTMDDEHIYALERSGIKKIIKYDKNFKEKIVIEEKDNNLLFQDIDVQGENVYVAVCQIAAPTKLIQYLYKYDKNLQLQEKIYVTMTAYPYNSMKIIKDKVYLVDKSHSKFMYEYDLATKTFNKIALDYEYAENLYHNGDNLIIEYYAMYNKNFPWTIYNVEKKEKKTLTFDNYEVYNGLPLFNWDKDNYYFLFKNKLVKVNKNNFSEKQIDLSKHKIENGHLLILKDK